MNLYQQGEQLCGLPWRRSDTFSNDPHARKIILRGRRLEAMVSRPGQEQLASLGDNPQALEGSTVHMLLQDRCYRAS